jgi:hypothetical protein
MKDDVDNMDPPGAKVGTPRQGYIQLPTPAFPARKAGTLHQAGDTPKDKYLLHV